MAEKKEESAAFSMADLGASLSAKATAGLVDVLKEKLQTLVGVSSGYIESLPDKVKRRIETLKKLQDQHKELEDKFFEEKLALETKYQKLYEPFYKKRYEIVNGLVEVEIAKENETKKEITDNEDKKGVPEFWLNAMKNNDVVGLQITERDEGALKFLKDITWSRLDGEKGFKLEFFFSENPYFKNSVLTKTYIMVDENEPILDHATGTDIDWLPGKNLTQKLMKKKPKKGSKNQKPVTKMEQCQSFFNFFDPPKVPGDEDEDVDDEAAEELQDVMEQDYEIGSTIRDKIIPHAVSWFTGEEGDEDEYISDDDDDDDAEEDDNSESDESGEEDEEDSKGEDNGHLKA